MAPQVAIMHEWLETFAGSEKVVEQILEVFPESDLFAVVDFLKGESRQMLKGKTVNTSFIQRMPFSRRLFRSMLPLMPMAVEQLDFSKYDIILSSNHAVAKGVITRADQLHISYVHTPIRYAWDLQNEYLREAKLTWGLKSMMARAILHYMRMWDRLAADRVDVFVANSHYVADRIRKTYRRDAEVIHPPVDVESFTFTPEKEDYYVAASRMVPYKRIDLIVEAFRKMPEKTLVVIGDGPEFKKIAALAGKNVQLLGHVGNDLLRERVRHAKAFLFAADEDFGIMPVEAQACGTPVIAFRRGGAMETVISGETGVFFDHQTPESIADAVSRFENHRSEFDPYRIRAHAERFSIDRFRRELAQLVDQKWSQFQDKRYQPQEFPESADV